MWIVRLALKYRYTFVVMALLITVLGATSILPILVRNQAGRGSEIAQR